MDTQEALQQIQAKLGHRFTDESLLQMALTHSSWVNEHGAKSGHNERLEYLGDAVLELAVSTELYQRFSTAREGELTNLRSSLVNTQVLATLARKLSLEGVLRLGRGEESQGGRKRDALLADAMEAVFGALYLDAGFIKARHVINSLYKELVPQQSQVAQQKDYKTQLQEATQDQQLKERGLPAYTLVGSDGPEHSRVFTVRVTLPTGQDFTAQGPSLKRAEQEAAKLALTIFEPKA